MGPDGIANVLVIGVNYGTDDEAIIFTKHLTDVNKHAQLNNVSLKIFVVDNTERSNNDNLYQKILQANSGVKYIKTPYNMGYFGGAKYGLKKYLRNNDLPDFVIVSNVDIYFKDRYFFESLIKYTDKAEIIAPSIWSYFSNRDQNPKILSRPNKYRMKFYKYCFSNYYLLNSYTVLSIIKSQIKNFYKFVSIIFKQKADEKKNSYETKNIYAPQGCCIIFSKYYFKKGGTLDYPLFLFNEEVYVAETARKMGLKILYVPALKVWHKDHASTGWIRTRKIAAFIAEAARFTADTYFK